MTRAAVIILCLLPALSCAAVTRFAAGAATSPASAQTALGTATVYLRDHCINEIDARIARVAPAAFADGNETANPDYALWTTRDGSTFTRKTTHLFAGVTGLSAFPAWLSSTSTTFLGYHLIAPDMLMGCAHASNITANPSTGTIVTFVSEDGNNTVVTRRVISSTVPPSIGGATPDITLYLLESDVPASINFLKIAPATLGTYLPILRENYAGAGYDERNVPMFTLSAEQNGEVALLISNSSVSSPSSLARNSVFGQFTAANGVTSRFQDYGMLKQSGDSGHAVCLIIRGELVLYGQYYEPTTGPTLPYWISSINTGMATLYNAASRTVRTVTQYDLSAFPALP